MPDNAGLDATLDRLARARTRRRYLEQKHWDLGFEVGTAVREQEEIEAELKGRIKEQLDSRAEQPDDSVSTIHLHLDGKQVAEAVARHAAGGSDGSPA